jgi:hypothetical protein
MTASELSVASLLAKIVILRHRVSPSASPMTGSSGVSSTLRPSGFITDASEYWIARFRGRRRLRVWRTHTHKTRLHDLAARCARVLDESSAPIEGVGNAGCPLHPRFRVHLVVVERTRVTTSTPESPGIPARNGFNSLCRALPGDRALLPPSSADMFCLSPVGPTQLRKT